jgi:uncharacterized protein
MPAFARLLLLFLLLPASAAFARDLAVPASQLLPAELVAVQVLADTGMAVVLLRVVDDDLPIFTGSAEAEAIERSWRKVRPPRPLTHELLGDLLEATGWRIERLVIDELREGQFLAALDLRHEDGRRTLLDTRPSDGLVLALRQGAPVLVARQVLEDALQDEDEGRPARPVLTASAARPGSAPRA